MPKTTLDYRGQKYVLWASSYRSAATRDGAGRVHDGHVVLEEFTVVVTDQHLTTDPHGSGLKLIAVTEAGERFHFEGRWWRDDEERAPHVDIVDALEMSDETHHFSMNTHVDLAGNPAIPGGAVFCRFHGCYYLPDYGCRKCSQDRSFQLGDGGEGPLYYLQCPFCEQMRSGANQEDQHWHLAWAHKAELEAHGVQCSERKRIRFSQFIEEAAVSA